MNFSKEPELKPTIAERLNNVLNLDAIPASADLVPAASQDIVVDVNPEKKYLDDLAKAQRTLNLLIDKGLEVVDVSIHFAKELQTPKAVESAAIAQDTARENVMALINLHKIRKEMERDSATKNGDTNITNNAVFVGTTGDLLRLTKEMNADGLLKQALSGAAPGNIIETKPLNTDEDK